MIMHRYRYILPCNHDDQESIGPTFCKEVASIHILLGTPLYRDSKYPERLSLPVPVYHLRKILKAKIPRSHLQILSVRWLTEAGECSLEIKSILHFMHSSSRPASTYHMPHTTYHMPHATCHIPHTTCHMPHATYHMPHATCHIPHAT